MRYLFYYCYHFLVSNSRHGTHSPFVYALADQVVYRKDFVADPTINLAMGIPQYVVPLIQKILTFWNIPALQDQDDLAEVNAVWVKDLALVAPDYILDLLKHGQVVFVQEPYAQQNWKSWKGLLKQPEVTVSINLFHFGMLIHRPVQHKEDFLLRWPRTLH